MLELEDTTYPVYIEWKEGNFVVKETDVCFNQVYTDQALEHVNRLCKLDGGLVGITRQQAALLRWMIIGCFRVSLTNNIHKASGSIVTWWSYLLMMWLPVMLRMTFYQHQRKKK